jgi:NAD(P)-dependent dehydrogenase (short-subunit alcohol dehydrogenase family)
MPAPMPVDRVVFIAGATGGLGRAAAAAFAAAGDRVVLCGTDRDRLAAVARDLHLADGRWVAAVGNLAEAAGARAAAAAAIDAFGRIDILLHLVGGFASGSSLVDVEEAEVRSMVDQHVWTTVNVAQAVVPGMVERGWGRVVAAATAAALTAPAKSGPYAAAKAAQEVLLRSLAKEVSSAGVTVNMVAVRAIDEKHERETAPSPKNVSWTTPEEIVATIVFLCSDEATAINGARIPLDGRT